MRFVVLLRVAMPLKLGVVEDMGRAASEER